MPAAAQDDEPGPSVFIFVFDEWSWPRSSRDGQFTADFPHLQALSKEATVYRNALSPFRETGQSLPRFIFQTDRELKIHDGRTWFERRTPLPSGRGAGVRETPTQDCRSLFQAARDARYRTYLLGFLHAYRHMLGDQVDVCRSYFAGDEAGPAERLVDELLENTRNWTDPLSRSYAAPLARSARREELAGDGPSLSGRHVPRAGGMSAAKPGRLPRARAARPVHFQRRRQRPSGRHDARTRTTWKATGGTWATPTRSSGRSSTRFAARENTTTRC